MGMGFKFQMGMCARVCVYTRVPECYPCTHNFCTVKLRLAIGLIFFVQMIA